MGTVTALRCAQASKHSSGQHVPCMKACACRERTRAWQNPQDPAARLAARAAPAPRRARPPASAAPAAAASMAATGASAAAPRSSSRRTSAARPRPLLRHAMPVAHTRKTRRHGARAHSPCAVFSDPQGLAVAWLQDSLISQAECGRRRPGSVWGRTAAQGHRGLQRVLHHAQCAACRSGRGRRVSRLRPPAQASKQACKVCPPWVPLPIKGEHVT